MGCIPEMSCNISCSVFGIQTPLKIKRSQNDRKSRLVNSLLNETRDKHNSKLGQFSDSSQAFRSGELFLTCFCPDGSSCKHLQSNALHLILWPESKH